MRRSKASRGARTANLHEANIHTTLLILPLTLHLLLHDLLPLVRCRLLSLTLDNLLYQPLQLVFATRSEVQIGIDIGQLSVLYHCLKLSKVGGTQTHG